MVRRGLFVVIAALALAPAANAGPVRSSHSGWFWGSPAPQAQNISALEFSGSTGYASGDFGTLMKTTDFGRTWSGIATGLTEDLNHMRILGPNTVIFGGTCALRRSDDGGATLRRLPWTASDESCSGGIVAFDFPSSNVGYLVLGNGNVLRSGDAGRTWSRRTAVPDTGISGVPGISPVDIDFVSDSVGYVATNGGELFQTSDGGNTWRTVLGEPWTIRSISFPTPNTGYVVGDAPAVEKTTDGGASWEEQALPGDVFALSKITCLSDSLCEAATHDGDRLVRTSDGGGFWDSVAASFVPLRAVALPAPDRVVSAGVLGITVLSENSGASFAPIGSTLTGQFNAVSALNSSVAYAYGQNGSLARTTNGGATWEETDAATSDNVRDISFLSSQRGYVLDTSGQLLLTTNGGDSYEILDTGTADAPQAVLAVNRKNVLLVGPAGVARSTDGRTFKPNTQPKFRKVPLFDADRAGNTVVAYGPDQVWLSNHGGASFRRISRPSKKTRVDVIDVVTRKTFFLLDARGYLYRTDSAGRHWRELSGLGTEIGFGMSFSDTKHGWVSVPEFGSDHDGWVMRTNDGGRTWEPQLLARSNLTRFGVAAAGKNAGFAVIGSNGLFGTKTGGSFGRVSKLAISTTTKRINRSKNGVQVRIRGKLSKARGGENVVVSYRENGSPAWLFQDVTVASSGSFTVVTRVKHGVTFVAQWGGDDRSRGAGSAPLRIPGPKPTK